MSSILGNAYSMSRREPQEDLSYSFVYSKVIVSLYLLFWLVVVFILYCCKNYHKVSDLKQDSFLVVCLLPHEFCGSQVWILFTSSAGFSA